MNKRKISVISTSRADYGHLFWTLKAIDHHPKLQLDLIICGSHLSEEFGRSIEQVKMDGFTRLTTLSTLIDGDSSTSMSATVANSINRLHNHLESAKPDILVIIADRYEMLAPATVALCSGIPIAHIEGGDISQGAIDDQVRNALTKISHLHFVATKQAQKRVIAMGEADWRVSTVGALSLDHLKLNKIPELKHLQTQLSFQLKQKYIIIAMHPLTIAEQSTLEIDKLLLALESFATQIQLIFCFPNADKGYRTIVSKVEAFCQGHSEAQLVVQLEHIYFWALMKNASLMLGNSSAGIMETASLKLPTINIGDRQKGRLQSSNIINSEASVEQLIRTIQLALSKDFKESLADCINLYDSGKIASNIIAETLANVPLGVNLLRKEFYPVSNKAPFCFIQKDADTSCSLRIN